MNDGNVNPYETPAAELINIDENNNISEFKRFTAWGVFGLGLITGGIYTIYWLYSRANIANTIHKKQISHILLVSLVIATVLSFASNFFGDSQMALAANLIITLAYVISYLVVVFKLRNRLSDVLSDSAGTQTHLGPILTFFFSSIYFQYKINECIDECSINS